MKRRHFFLLSLGGLATIALPSFFIWKNISEKKNPLYEPKTLNTILEPSAIVKIGEKYCQQFPDAKLEKKLRDALEHTVNMEDCNLESLLEMEIKKDYETGNTVMLDGWILSETEAKQCALLSISRSKQS